MFLHYKILIYILSISGKPVNVWIIGSSIIKHAFVHARKRPGGIHLGLKERLGVEIFWQGKGGMRWWEVKKKIRHLLTLADEPDILLIHCGGNDFRKKSIELRMQMIQDLEEISVLLPSTKLVWSQMLPRPLWLTTNDAGLENARIRLNSFVGSKILSFNNGYYVKYPDINIKSLNLFYDDGVHLSSAGNEVFLGIIQGGLEYVIQNKGKVFPDNY